MFYIFKHIVHIFLFINVYGRAILEAEAKVRYLLNRFKPQVIIYITVHSKAVLLIWFSVFACLGVSFCTVEMIF